MSILYKDFFCDTEHGDVLSWGFEKCQGVPINFSLICVLLYYMSHDFILTDNKNVKMTHESWPMYDELLNVWSWKFLYVTKFKLKIKSVYNSVKRCKYVIKTNYKNIKLVKDHTIDKFIFKNCTYIFKTIKTLLMTWKSVQNGE